jgi:hypothetical protein
MKTLENRIEVMWHFANGGKVKSQKLWSSSVPELNLNPSWNWADFDYFIYAWPKYRPFATIEEISQYIGSVVKNNRGNFIAVITSAELVDGGLQIRLDGQSISSQALIDKYTFLNGKIVGIEL